MDFIKIFHLALAFNGMLYLLYRYEMIDFSHKTSKNPHPSEKLMGLFLKRKPHPILELHTTDYQFLVLNFQWGFNCHLQTENFPEFVGKS